MTAYATLLADKGAEGSIKSWVNMGNIPSTTILTEAEQLIYDRLRVREMLATEAGTMTVDQDYLSLPTRYVATSVLRFTGIYKAKLQRKHMIEVEERFVWDASGNRVSNKPTCFYALADRLQMDHPADLAYPYRNIYYARPAPLSDQNPTNFLTETKPRLLRAMCCALAFEFDHNDSEKDYWLKVAGEMISASNEESDSEMIDAEMRMVPV